MIQTKIVTTSAHILLWTRKEGISCLPPREKKTTSMTTPEGKEYYKECQILFPIKHFAIAYFSTDSEILSL